MAPSSHRKRLLMTKRSRPPSKKTYVKNCQTWPRKATSGYRRKWRATEPAPLEEKIARTKVPRKTMVLASTSVRTMPENGGKVIVMESLRAIFLMPPIKTGVPSPEPVRCPVLPPFHHIRRGHPGPPGRYCQWPVQVEARGLWESSLLTQRHRLPILSVAGVPIGVRPRATRVCCGAGALECCGRVADRKRK